ncbi:MAG: hypothetical protein KDD70_07985 [Bdellovibrionales bacterium]|nr:hypothetical protein [Bdellovibrionales bacterium]
MRPEKNDRKAPEGPSEQNQHAGEVTVRLPRWPTQELHPLIGLPVASIYSAENLSKFTEAVLATFWDVAEVNTANDCGYREEVDRLIGSPKDLIPLHYGNSDRVTDVPGFDEGFNLCELSRGSAVERWNKFVESWNERLNALLPMSDKRAQVAESSALLRSETNILKSEFKEFCKQSGLEGTVAEFGNWILANLRTREQLNSGSFSQVQQVGELALRLAEKRQQAKLEQIAEGKLPDEERRVLRLIYGHVLVDEPLTPHKARAAADFAEKLATDHKKGIGGMDEISDLSQWIDRRKGSAPGKTASDDEVDTILKLEEQYAQMMREMYAADPDSPPASNFTERIAQLRSCAQKMYRIVASDRELGPGVIRAEKVEDAPMSTFVGENIKEGDVLTRVQIDLSGGGAFTKAFGFAGFGSLFREINNLVQEYTGAKFTFRKGGGKIVLFTDKNREEIDITELGRKIDALCKETLEGDGERATGAKIEYGIRMARKRYVARKLDLPPPGRIDETDFLSAVVKLGTYTYRESHSVQDGIGC